MLKVQLDPISQNDAQQLRECSEGRSAIQALRNDLHDAEERLAQAEARSKETDVRTHCVSYFTFALRLLMSAVAVSPLNHPGEDEFFFYSNHFAVCVIHLSIRMYLSMYVRAYTYACILVCVRVDEMVDIL